ncbi:DUF6233 domain-containing protein [Streptomyces sp. NPDC021354]|uniref:DUF6233 domain-containing protein n=1 Tax=Streptomyces sp. NPDC021354 TaxID=3154793 RepID=UPI0033D50835
MPERLRVTTDEARSAPPVRIELPDGQEIVGRLIRRWESEDGWAYRVAVPLWGSVQRDGRDVLEPVDQELDVPASHVERVDGVSYRGVPTLRRDHPLTEADRAGPTAPGSGSGPWPPVRGDASDRWKVQRPRLMRPQSGPRPVVVHHAECFVCPGPAELSTEQAREVLAWPEAAACDLCGASQLAPSEERPPRWQGNAR